MTTIPAVLTLSPLPFFRKDLCISHECHCYQTGKALLHSTERVRVAMVILIHLYKPQVFSYISVPVGGATEAGEPAPSKGSSATPLVQWTEMGHYPGMVCCLAQATSTPVVMFFKPDVIQVHELKATKSKVQELLCIYMYTSSTGTAVYLHVYFLCRNCCVLACILPLQELLCTCMYTSSTGTAVYLHVYFLYRNCCVFCMYTSSTGTAVYLHVYFLYRNCCVLACILPLQELLCTCMYTSSTGTAVYLHVYFLYRNCCVLACILPLQELLCILHVYFLCRNCCVLACILPLQELLCILHVYFLYRNCCVFTCILPLQELLCTCMYTSSTGTAVYFACIPPHVYTYYVDVCGCLGCV